uniref:Uncharacterized protein n=1 Tax=Oryza sativa subsp. japonica TaxID=39947 RepID=Q2QU94_ORYSJ|nr:hypothetical protein LOC_Os12g17030 [Oryza sativa Japonica Group]
MKIIFFFALLAIAACSASAQFDAVTQVYRQYQLQPHLMVQQQMLSPCAATATTVCWRLLRSDSSSSPSYVGPKVAVNMRYLPKLQHCSL